MELVMLAFGRSSRLLDRMLHPFTVTKRNWEYDVHPYIMIHDIIKSYAKSAKCSKMINYDIQIFHDTSIGNQLTKGLGLPALKWMVLSQWSCWNDGRMGEPTCLECLEMGNTNEHAMIVHQYNDKANQWKSISNWRNTYDKPVSWRVITRVANNSNQL